MTSLSQPTRNSEVETLTVQKAQLEKVQSGWEIALSIALAVTAIAALLVFVFDLGVRKYSKRIQEKQDEVIRAKDAQLELSLRDKDVKIAEAGQKAAEATAQAEAERMARLKLQKQLVPRRLTGTQKETLVDMLKVHPDEVVIVSSILDGEGSDYADDFDLALKAAHWRTLRIKNHLSDRYGVRLGSVAGTTLPGTRRLQDAFDAIGVHYEQATFSPDDHSTDPWFQSGVIYLVIEHKPEPHPSETK